MDDILISKNLFDENIKVSSLSIIEVSAWIRA